MPPECDAGHVYHLFPVLTPRRDAFQQHLAARGIGTLVHYPIPIPNQAAFTGQPAASCPVAERTANEVCSLPLHPRLTTAEVAAVVDAVRAWDS